MKKHGPRTNSTKPHKYRQIQQHINSRLQRIIFSLETKPIVPRERISGNEASQHIITADHATSSDDEESEGDGKDEKAFSIDESFLFGPVQELFRDPTNCCTVDDAEDDGVAPGFAEPKAHGCARPSMLASTSFTGVFDQVKGEE